MLKSIGKWSSKGAKNFQKRSKSANLVSCSRFASKSTTSTKRVSSPTPQNESQNRPSTEIASKKMVTPTWLGQNRSRITANTWNWNNRWWACASQNLAWESHSLARWTPAALGKWSEKVPKVKLQTQFWAILRSDQVTSTNLVQMYLFMRFHVSMTSQSSISLWGINSLTSHRHLVRSGRPCRPTRGPITFRI